MCLSHASPTAPGQPPCSALTLPGLPRPGHSRPLLPAELTALGLHTKPRCRRRPDSQLEVSPGTWWPQPTACLDLPGTAGPSLAEGLPVLISMCSWGAAEPLSQHPPCLVFSLTWRLPAVVSGTASCNHAAELDMAQVKGSVTGSSPVNPRPGQGRRSGMATLDTSSEVPGGGGGETLPGELWTAESVRHHPPAEARR